MVRGFGRLFKWKKRMPIDDDNDLLHSHPLGARKPKQSAQAKKSKTFVPKLKRSFSLKKSKPERKPERPEPNLVCYLCSQPHPKSTLMTHVTQCLRSWNRREQIKPEDEQVPVPQRPVELDGSLPEDPTEVERFNKTMRSIWRNATNLTCKTCKQTFKAGGIPRAGAYYKHVKTCGVAAEEEKPPVCNKERRKSNKHDDKFCVAVGEAQLKHRRQSFTEKKSKKEIVTEPLLSLNRLRSQSFTLKSMKTVKNESKKVIQQDQTPPGPPKLSRKSVPVKLIKEVSFKSQETEVDRQVAATARKKELDDLRNSVQQIKSRSSKAVANASSGKDKGEDQKRSRIPRPSTSDVGTSRSSKSSDRGDRPSLDKSSSFSQRGYVCYLCGREFGSASLAIHLKQCRQLWKDRESLKRRKSERRAPPTPPPELNWPLPTDKEAKAEFNSTMTAIWESRALVACHFCGRTFTAEAFEKHQRVCTESNPGGPLGPSKHKKTPSYNLNASACDSKYRLARSSSDSGPIQYCCYLCGRQYSRRSYFLHIPRCQKLWEDREEAKPDKKQRRPLPPPPSELEGFPDVILPTDPNEVLEFNNSVYTYWDKVSLYTCSFCSRSFNEEAFEKHKKLCPCRRLSHSKKFPSFKDSSSESSDGGKKEPKTPKHYVCYLCGRQYGSKSLMIHIKHCERHWVSEEDMKPARHRRALPSRPERLDRDLPTDRQDIEEFNDEMLKYWERHTLVECPTCKRSFKFDALEKHRKNCSLILTHQ